MDRRRLQSAAAQYPYLRGLFSIPLGVLCVVAALGNWEWGPLRHAWVFVVVVLLMVLVCVPINRYYNERFGRVTPSVRQQVRATLAGVAGVALMVGGATLLRSDAAWSLDLPVNAIAAMFAMLMLVYYAALVGLRTHHVVVWGALLLVGLLPVWNGADPSNIGLVLAGMAAMINGVFDHRLLARVVAPSPTSTVGPEHAGG